MGDEQVTGNLAAMETYLHEARQAAERVAEPDEKQLLLDDLGTIA